MQHSRYQDVVGQFPQLKSYNHSLMVFPLDSNVSQNFVATTLNRALNQIISKIPWLGGQVVQDEGVDGNQGCIKIIPLPSGRFDNKILYVKDCTALCPSYEALVQKGAPVSMLDGQVLCPFPAFPLSYDEAKIGPPPVAVVQVSFIKGGAILTFSNQHNMMDASGMFAFAALLSAAMQGNELDQNLIDQANIDRAKVIPLLDPDQPIRDHKHYFKTASHPSQSFPAPPARWAIFRLSREAVPQIKTAASNKAEFVPSVSYISSNDALCAFYWKRLAAVRVANGTINPVSTSKFLRAIDVRSTVGVPLGYMGQMVYHASTRFSYHELASAEVTLSTVTSRLRADLNDSNNEWAIRSYATFLASIPDKSQLVYGGGFNPTFDIGSSSVAQLAPEALHFGILGKATYVRRPNLPPLPGFMYIYPPEGDNGDFPILVCLNEKDMEGLKSDKEWGAVTDFIG